MNLTNISFSLPSLIFVLIIIGIYLLKKKLENIGDYLVFEIDTDKGKDEKFNIIVTKD